MSFTASAALVLLLACLGTLHSSGTAADARAPTAAALPNIIFLLTDDQRADTLSIAGHPDVRTPNLDALARAGVRFSNAFTVQPICAPSRFAFLSGQYERVSGLGFNSPYQVSEAQWARTYPALLRDAGYFTGFIGKFGVEFYDLPGGGADRFDYWRAHDGWLPFFPKDLPDNPATAIYREAEHDITTEIMGEYLEEFLQLRPRGQPFQLSVSFSAPHNSVVSSMYSEGADPNCADYACRVMGYAANGNPRLRGHPVYDSLYRDLPIRVSPDTGEDPYRFIPEGIISHAARQKWYAYNYDAALEREHLVRYYQTITGVDRVIGRLMELLETHGLADDTVIIFSSDHGLLNGEYGTGGKALLYDLVARVPLIVFDPRRPPGPAAVVRDDLVLSIDVPASILALAGIEPPDTMQGSPLMVDATKADGVPRQDVFLESLTVAEGNPFIEAIRTHDLKYVRYFQRRGCPYDEAELDFSSQAPIYEQLFDLRRDPGERVNLVGDARYAGPLERLRTRAHERSAALTLQGRRYKQALPVAQRPAEDAYCW